MALVRPSAQFEFPTAKLADFAIYLFCLASFGWFLRTLVSAERRSPERQAADGPAIPGWVWIVAGYTLFIWSSLQWITLTSNTPDMLAAGLAYIGWGLLFRLEEREGPAHYLLLGLVLALSYFARTPMFIVACVILVLVAQRRSSVARRRGAIAAALVFVALTTPFILSISLARGHVTVGDNGALNHVWLASPGGYIVPNRHWQGGPPGNGHPRHPSRVLWNKPPTFEFATPIGGTYPPWTDPSYWYEGLKFHFDAGAEWSSLKDNIRFYDDLFGGGLLIVLVAALACGASVRSTLSAVGRNTRYWAPAAAGLALFLVANDLLVQRTPTPQPPSRYVAVFAVLFSLIMASSLRFRPVQRFPIVRRTVGWCIPILSVAILALLTAAQLDALRQTEPATPWEVTQDLQKAGLAPSTRVATIGSPSRHEFWARLMRVQIVAEVPDEAMFWATSPDNQELVLRMLARTGAQAVVSSTVPSSALDRGWQLAKNTEYGIHLLADPGTDAAAALISQRVP